MPLALDRYYTREEVLAFPEDGNRYELVHGELLVSPAPRSVHQRIVRRLVLALSPYVEAHAIGELWTSPADVSWGGLADVTVQPDVFVEATAQSRGRGLREWIDMDRFHLFVEVTSPSTARQDRFTKRTLYQKQRVSLYWVIDPELRRAEIWTPDATWPVIEERELVWAPVPGVEPLRIGLEGLFEE